MTEIKRILVPTDFAACSRAALDHAIMFADRFDAAIHIAHVWQPPRYVAYNLPIAGPGEEPETLIDVAKQRSAQEMEQLADATGKMGSLPMTTHFAMGDIAKGILELADKEAVDLIVMGTHGRGALGRLFLGSVAAKIVRHSKCPVLTVRCAETTE